jgi:hypothetical protein
VVVITHDRDVAASFPRRVGIQDGRIAFDERDADAGAPSLENNVGGASGVGGVRGLDTFGRPARRPA